MLTLHNDIRYAFRLILKNRLSSLFMALVLAVGTGANTAVFSMVDAIVRRPFPFHDIDRVVTLSETLLKAGAQRYGVSAGNFIDWKSESRVLERAAAYKESAAIFIGRESKEPVDVSLVSPGFFQILGLAPYAGRYYSEREICEIVWLVASEHLYNMTNIGLNIHSDMLCDISRKRSESAS